MPDSRAALVSPFFAHPVLCRPPDAPSPLLASTTSSADRHRLPDPSVNWVDAAARDSAASSPEREGDRWLPEYTGGPASPHGRTEAATYRGRSDRPVGSDHQPEDRTRLAAMNPAGDEGDPGPPRQTTGPAFARITATEFGRIKAAATGGDGLRAVDSGLESEPGDTAGGDRSAVPNTIKRTGPSGARRSKTTSRRGVSPLPTLRAVYLTDMMSVWQMSADI